MDRSATLESLRALAYKEIPIEFKQGLYYTVLLLAYLSMFRTTRWWVFFVMRAFWRFYYECWIHYFLLPNIENDAILVTLLDGHLIERAQKSWTEMWNGLWSRRAKKKLRKKHKDVEKRVEEQTIRHGLVFPDGTRPFEARDTRLSKEVQGIVQRRDAQRAVSDSGHSRHDSGISGTSTTENAKQGQTGQNGTIGKNKKNKGRKSKK